MAMINFNMRKSGKKGFTLLEVLAAIIILMIIAVHLAVIYLFFYAQLITTIHKLDAINYAGGLANRLASQEYPVTQAPEFSEGEHNITTDPSLCKLPDVYFKIKLEGKIKYFVSYPPELTINVAGAEALPVRQIKIVVEWTEVVPIKHTAQEIVYLIA